MLKVVGSGRILQNSVIFYLVLVLDRGALFIFWSVQPTVCRVLRNSSRLYFPLSCRPEPKNRTCSLGAIFLSLLCHTDINYHVEKALTLFILINCFHTVRSSETLSVPGPLTSADKQTQIYFCLVIPIAPLSAPVIDATIPPLRPDYLAAPHSFLRSPPP